MNKIEIITVGTLKEKYLKNGCAEYKKRLTPFTKIIETNINEVKLPLNYSEKDILYGLNKEGEKILGKLKPSSVKVILEIEGKNLSSEQLAEYIENQSLQGKSYFQFVIGSSFGLDDRVKKQADLSLSFSKMTFPHQLMQLLLFEQIYRAFSIINNSKYHK